MGKVLANKAPYESAGFILILKSVRVHVANLKSCFGVNGAAVPAFVGHGSGHKA